MSKDITKKVAMVTVDCETTMNNDTVGSNKASPFHANNRIVLLGGKSSLDVNPHICPNANGPMEFKHSAGEPVSILNGQNIKFDLHYLRKKGTRIDGLPVDAWLVDNQVWDTQLAEYILVGSEARFVSLDNLCLKYGQPLKAKNVTEMFAKGIGADKIDEDILKKYLIGDLISTEAIAAQQMQVTIEANKLPFVMSMMDCLLAVEDMEYNGIAINHKLLKSYRDELSEEIERVEKETQLLLSGVVLRTSAASPHVVDIININSNEQLSAIFFGGTITWTEREQVGHYKNGKQKFKNVERSATFNGLATKSLTVPTAKPDVYKVDEEVLQKIQAYAIANKSIVSRLGGTLAQQILKLRKMRKELGTYYDGLAKLIYHDGLLHPNIHMTSTVTGRTSSTEPNSQNIPSHEESNVKRLFVSRFGDDGMIVSADFNQLEVVGLAYLSDDPQLVADIINGVDIHSVLAMKHFGKASISKDERRIIKTINFGLIYGGTANTLSVQAGITKSEAQAAIDNFYQRYPGVRDWQGAMNESVLNSSTPSMGKTKNGLPARRGTLEIPTGRKFVFTEYDNPFRRGTTNFSPTEIKNYPVQGLAADIVYIMLGILWRKLKKIPDFAGKCFMVNVVHDEYVLDVHKSVLYEVCKVLKNTLESTPEYLNSKLNLKFNLPIKVNISCGPNWKDLTEYP